MINRRIATYLTIWLAVLTGLAGCTSPDDKTAPELPEYELSEIGRTTKPADYGLEEFGSPFMVDAAVVGIGTSPSGLTGPVVDILWGRPIDSRSVEPSRFIVGRYAPTEVWVDGEDNFVMHLYFDRRTDEVGGTVQFYGGISDIWGVGAGWGGAAIEAGFWGENEGMAPFSGPKVNKSGDHTPFVQNVATVYAGMTATAGGVISAPQPKATPTSPPIPAPTIDEDIVAATVAASILATQYPGGGITDSAVLHAGVTAGEAIANVRNYIGRAMYLGGVLVDRTPTPVDILCSITIERKVDIWAAQPLGATSWRVVALLKDGETFYEKTILEWDFYPTTLAVNPSYGQRC